MPTHQSKTISELAVVEIGIIIQCVTKRSLSLQAQFTVRLRFNVKVRLPLKVAKATEKGGYCVLIEAFGKPKLVFVGQSLLQLFHGCTKTVC